MPTYLRTIPSLDLYILETASWVLCACKTTTMRTLLRLWLIPLRDVDGATPRPAWVTARRVEDPTHCGGTISWVGSPSLYKWRKLAEHKQPSKQAPQGYHSSLLSELLTW